MTFSFESLGLLLFAIGAPAVWRAGFRISNLANVISARTGLGQALVGVLLLGGVTSLPELATSVTAALGGATAGGPPALTTVGTFASVAASLGILLTALYMIGLSERRDATYGRLGIDSIVVIVAYPGGVALLFTLR